jgi:hypothetical protein
MQKTMGFQSCSSKLHGLWMVVDAPHSGKVHGDMSSGPLARWTLGRRFSAGVTHKSQQTQLTYFAAVIEFTEMESPFAVPVTLACSQASLLSLSSVP